MDNMLKEYEWNTHTEEKVKLNETDVWKKHTL